MAKPPHGTEGWPSPDTRDLGMAKPRHTDPRAGQAPTHGLEGWPSPDIRARRVAKPRHTDPRAGQAPTHGPEGWPNPDTDHTKHTQNTAPPPALDPGRALQPPPPPVNMDGPLQLTARKPRHCKTKLGFDYISGHASRFDVII